MRKSIYLWSLALASVFATGCSQDDLQPGASDADNGQSTVSYLSVNVLSTDKSSTRAEGDVYENGTPEENNVKKVRFYFFDGNGAASNVILKGNSYVNYHDWTPGSNDQSMASDGNNVASMLKATIVINTKKGDKLPQQIAAVINPAESLQSRSLQSLKDITKDYAASGLTGDGTFVMFNSVYKSAGTEYCAVPLTSENLAKSEEDAKNNPVQIYVERNVAKVSIDLKEAGFDNDTKLIPLKDKEGKSLMANGKQIYLKINGWKLTAITDKGRLVKDIDLTWTSSWWNLPASKRSCWAINASDAVNQYFSYNEITPTESNIDKSIYTNENAEDYTINNNPNGLNKTKFILSGTLCDQDGKSITIVRHLGALFADSFDKDDEKKNLIELKKNILAQLQANGNHYYYKGLVTENGVSKEGFIGIDVDDLEISAFDLVEKEDSKNNCYVYAKLSKDGENKTWYSSAAENAEPMTDAKKTINETLKSVDKALVWRSGMTYYYSEIKHNDDGTIGVVRNHVYKASISKIAGLGTPVYNPDEKIYPEKPDPNDHYIAAKINILAWHIVNSDYKLEW